MVFTASHNSGSEVRLTNPKIGSGVGWSVVRRRRIQLSSKRNIALDNFVHQVDVRKRGIAVLAVELNVGQVGPTSRNRSAAARRPDQDIQRSISSRVHARIPQELQ